MGKKYKVLIVTGKLQRYRIPIFNLIANNTLVDLTVAHSYKKLDDGSFNFKEVILKEYKIGPFTIHNTDFMGFCNSFDVVVATFYLQKISFMRLLFNRKRNFKIIYWGIGVKASQKSNFDDPTILNYFRYYIAKKSDAMIFYTNYAVEKYIAKGIDKSKLFTMNNTVEVCEQITYEPLKDRIIFVGTLNKSKKIDVLLNAYFEARQTEANLPILEIIGEGVDFEYVKNWIRENRMSEKIVIHGGVYEEATLEKIFKRALACISPGQAGLSVLTSFGYGVPFITNENAITGGERLNIQDNVNGKLFKNKTELKKIIIEIAQEPEKYINLGNNARDYYINYRTPEIMVQGFLDAINYVTQHNNY